MPEQQLAHIDEALGDLLDEIGQIRKWLTGERRKRRIAVGLLSGAVAISFLGLFATYLVAEEVDDERRLDDYEACLRSNEGRQGVLTAMDVLIDELIAGRENEPEIQERLARLNENLVEALPMSNCRADA